MANRVMPLLLIVLFTLALSAQRVESANILGIFSSHSPSHLIVHMSLMKALAERGHNITVVSAYKPTVTHKAIHHIIIPPTPEQQQELDAFLSGVTEMDNNMFTLFRMILSSMRIMMDLQFELVQDARFAALYDHPQPTKFDVVFVGFFFNDYQLGFGPKFGAPLIVDFSAGSNDLLDHYVGNPSQIAYVPNMLVSVKPGEMMTFPQRVRSFVSSVMFKIVASVINYRMKNYYNQLFPMRDFPTYTDVQKNVSLLFVNGHFSEGPIRADVPALVEIGGIQVKDKPDPLPQDIADHLDAAKKHGAILFSLGSNVKSSSFKPEMMNTIYRVLSKLKQHVIWKWEDLEKTPGNAPNILFKKWLPQDDILAHPNLRLFITHAGKGGITESIYHGVPMVALPVFADQSSNAERMVDAGYGLQLKMITLKEDELRQAVNEVLNNPVYRENVVHFSQLYRDRPLSAKESVVYWTEYVIRHKGAAHMQSPLKHMNAIQAANYDVYAFIFVVLFIVYKLVRIILRVVCAGVKSLRTKLSGKKLKKH